MPGPYLIDDVSRLDTLDGADAVIETERYGVQCVALVKKYSSCGKTSAWTQGDRVREVPHVAKGTAIATFNANGKYASNPSGNHACFFIKPVGDIGFWVLEQHVKPDPDKIQQRMIRYHDGQPAGAVDDGNSYSIIL